MAILKVSRIDYSVKCIDPNVGDLEGAEFQIFLRNFYSLIINLIFSGFFKNIEWKLSWLEPSPKSQPKSCFHIHSSYKLICVHGRSAYLGKIQKCIRKCDIPVFFWMAMLFYRQHLKGQFTWKTKSVFFFLGAYDLCESMNGLRVSASLCKIYRWFIWDSRVFWKSNLVNGIARTREFKHWFYRPALNREHCAISHKPLGCLCSLE